MRIQHNIMAMNAYRNYNKNTSALSKNLERLSSGYKINRAGDDAAGLAISEKMRAQITGLDAAQKNVKDGISLVNTAEGAMQEIQDMLNRMMYLATQSANGTYDNDVDRKNLQAEVDQLRSEIDRIADSANFNGIKLLDGKEIMQKSAETSPLGELLTEKGVDGAKGPAAGNASVTIQMGSVSTDTVTPKYNKDESVDGKTASAAKQATIKFTTVANSAAAGDKVSIGGTAIDGDTKFDALGGLTLGGAKISEYFDMFVGNSTTAADWTDNSSALGDGVEITLVAKNYGDLGTTFNTAASGLTNATYTAGVDEGGDSQKTQASYELTIDLTKLKAGQVLEFGGKSFIISADPTQTNATGTITVTNEDGTTATHGVIKIAGLDINDDADVGNTANGGQQAVADNIVNAFKDGTNGFNDGTDVKITSSGVTSGKLTFTMEIKSGGAYEDEKGNLGELRVLAADATNEAGLDAIADMTTTQFTPAAKGTPGQNAKLVYKDAIDTSKLVAGSTITIGDATVTVVDGTKTKEDLSKGLIAVANVGNATKLSQAFQSQTKTGSTEPVFDAGQIKFTANGTKLSVEITGKQTDTVAGMAADYALEITAGQAALKATAGTASGDTSGKVDIETGKTTVQDLIDAYGDNYDISVLAGGAADAEKNTDSTTDYKIEIGDTIKLTAKVAGKMGDATLASFTPASGSAGVTVAKDYGWNEGSSSGSVTTHYDVTFDLNEIAGGQTFSFGNNKTFEISLDGTATANQTANGTTGAGAEVATRNSILIDLSTVDTSDKQAVADKIVSTVKTAMGASTFNTTADKVASDGTFTMNVDAIAKGEATNYGGARFTATGGGITEANYSPYNGISGDQPNTYAQVTWEFDKSALKSGDSITIGDATVYFGDVAKDEAIKDEDGNVTGAKVTLTKNASEADIVKAFERAGYTGGQIKIANGELTITGIKAGETAEELAGDNGLGKVTFNTTRDMTAVTGGLNLQIGDTSDPYNRLTVSIKDMHYAAMGEMDKDGNVIEGRTIADINIGSQDGAQDAINVIKGAINYVSSVRGTLGAISNRLDHTANNLSVMAENIQDAESTIRDTDIANEMMSYTKNNILVQSAQAMLAQANQVPQGVLQLLQ